MLYPQISTNIHKYPQRFTQHLWIINLLVGLTSAELTALHIKAIDKNCTVDSIKLVGLVTSHLMKYVINYPHKKNKKNKKKQKKRRQVVLSISNSLMN